MEVAEVGVEAAVAAAPVAVAPVAAAVVVAEQVEEEPGSAARAPEAEA